MQQPSAVLLTIDRHDVWASVTLGAPVLANAAPGQFLALRCALPGSFDPLPRQPVFIAAGDVATGTCQLLLRADDPALRFLEQLPAGAALDVLGPLGHGWTIDLQTRTIALVGVATQAAPLIALARHAVARGAAVALLLGAPKRSAAPPPFLLPAAAEYNIAASRAEAAAALSSADDMLLRWADMLAVALPFPFWGRVAQRVGDARIRWSRGFAQVAVLPPLACSVGLCGACEVETRNGHKLACADGPIFDLRDLVR